MPDQLIALFIVIAMFVLTGALLEIVTRWCEEIVAHGIEKRRKEVEDNGYIQ